MAWFFWDPSREIFTLPYFHFPVVWYSLFFAIGFLSGYYIFRHLIFRYLSFYPQFQSQEVKDSALIKLLLTKEPKTDFQKTLAILYQKENRFQNNELTFFFNHLIEHPEILEQKIPSKEKSRLAVRLFIEKAFGKNLVSLSQKAANLSDRLFFYMILATIIGARLGHIFFYENWTNYLIHPIRILKTWEGGLASHGAGLAILFALAIYVYSIRKIRPKFTWVKILDLISAPVAFCGCFIRIGNFMNQEILGTASTLPWAVIFGHPADGSIPIPRHPAQLYEAIGYFFIFILLFLLQKKQAM